jgi:hypothetical protein
MCKAPMNAAVRHIALSTIAFLFIAAGSLIPSAPAHDRGDYQAGYERGYSNGYQVGYRESADGEEYSNHFPDGYDAYSVGFHDGQHAGYDRGYREGRRRGWHYGREW